MPKKNSTLRKSLIIGIGILLFVSSGPVQAGALDNITGWAWIGANCTDVNELTRTDLFCDQGTTDPIGWISFNNIQDPPIGCSSVSYGVNVDYDTGEISGAAWIGVGENSVYGDCNTSENTLGWLYFDTTDTPSCGSGGYPDDGYCSPARIVSNEIQGWAPIISKDGAGTQIIVTWVKFNGSNYSVKINSDGTVSSNAIEHYAWSGKGGEGGLGWIDMADVVFPPLNRAPDKPTSLGEAWNHCDFQELSKPTFSWDYSDQDGDDMIAYEIWIADNSDFSDPKFNHVANLGAPIPSGGLGSYTLDLNQDDNSDWITKLAWNTTYYWKVIVKDSTGAWSEWMDYDDFLTPKHAYPWPVFTWSPQKPSIGEETQFTDKTTFYDGSLSWSWTFQDGNPANSDEQNPVVKFNSTGDKTITLGVSDSDGYGCTIPKTIKPTLPLPRWREVPPVSMILRFLADISSIVKSIIGFFV